MIELTHDQGSKAWFRARAGIPTGSEFGQFLTPLGAMRSGEMPKTYAGKLLAERLWGYIDGGGASKSMQYGKEQEAAARTLYSFQFDQAREVGFVLDNGKRWGCSPDGLVGDDGGIEIKCLYPKALAKCLNLCAPLPEHVFQIQACLWVTGREWWDYVLYKPEWDAEDLGLIDIRTEDQRAQAGPELFRVRCYPDEKLHAAFAENVPTFCDDLDEMEREIRAKFYPDGGLAEHEEDA